MSARPMWKYAMLISYRGSSFCGWQKQKGSAASGAPSIQETIEEALMRMVTEQGVSVTGSGRTDAGVHATGQVGHFTLRRKEWDPGILRKGLNSNLPHSIRVLDLKAVPITFHAQIGAIQKQYSYYFQQGPAPLPHLLPFTWWIRKKLDVSAMTEALSHLIGEHDFKPFQSSGASVTTTVRTLFEADVTPQGLLFPGGTAFEESGTGLVRMRLVGSGFLRQMVRGIAGTLVQVGEGKRKPDGMKEILDTGRRDLLGATAPGRGLWLERVWYPEISWF